VTGETALQAFRKHIHPAVGWFFIIALTIGVCGSVMGVMGIVAEVSSEWSRSFVEGGIHPFWFALIFVSLVYYIFWNGQTQFFERALAVIVAVMCGCFLLNFVLLMPPPNEIFSGLLPSLPETTGDPGISSLLVVTSMVGTTVFSGLFIIRTTLIKEAGWTLADSTKQRNDAMLAVTMMFLISASIMAASAGTLFEAGAGLEKASQMIVLLEPLAGAFATSIFAVGIVAAGVSSQFPNVLMLPWLLCDYHQSERNMKLPQYRLMVLGISVLGLVVPIFSARPVVVMILSQAFNALILPATVAGIMYLGNREDLMGKHKNNMPNNVIMTGILVFSFITCAIGIRGVWFTVGAL